MNHKNLEAEEPLAPELGPVLVTDEEGRRPFLVHLEELRRRALRSFLWVGVGTLCAFRYAGHILALLIQPVGTVVFLSPTEPFMVYLKVAFLSGIALSLPLLFWEAWGFLAPALMVQRRRVLFFLVPASTLLFLLGAAFGWGFLLPAALKFLLSFSSQSLTPMITVGSYVGFASWLIVGCGVIFQTPILILFLTRLGVVHPWTLIRQWRLAVIGILILAAALTPTPDVVNQLLLAAPMAVLYFLSVLVSFSVAR